MISRAARTLGPMRLPSSWPSCIVRDTRDILTLNGGNVFNVGIVHRQQIFKDHFLIIDDRFLNFFWAAPEGYPFGGYPLKPGDLPFGGYPLKPGDLYAVSLSPCLSLSLSLSLRWWSDLR